MTKAPPPKKPPGRPPTSKPVAPKPLPPEMIVEKYGLKWNPLCDVKGRPVGPQPIWRIECIILKDYDTLVKMRGQKLMPWCEHFKLLVTMFCGDPNGAFFFEWNPNAERILENFYKHRLLAIAGCASSGKTEALACIAVFYWLIDPFNTKVLLTSLTAKSAKGKIWGSVTECWQQLCRVFGDESKLPGKLIASEHIIRYSNMGVITSKAGLELVVGEASKAKESAEKIQGYKRGKVLLCADELATLAPSLLDTALTNLKVNDDFHMAAGFNPDSYFDPGGRFSKPKAGWHTISEHSTEWETIIEPIGLTGYCIRFDGEQSPNVLAGRKVWRGLMASDYLNDLKTAFGPKTKSYWKMVRGYWSPTGSADAIYTEAEIITHRADAPVTTWIEPPVMVAGLDPAFAHGGDRAALSIGRTGVAQSPDTGAVQRVFELVKLYSLDDDITDKKRSKPEWIVELLGKRLAEHKVSIHNLAIDATGGGDPFASLIARDHGHGFLQIQFGGSPSDRRVSKSDPRPAKDRFLNMVSELWMVGIELVRTGQFKGLLPDVVAEMTARTYNQKNNRNLVAVESKADMKKRTQKSPDLADATFLALHVARQRHSLVSSELAAKKPLSAYQKGDRRSAGLLDWNAEKRKPSFREEVPSVGGAGGWGD